MGLFDSILKTVGDMIQDEVQSQKRKRLREDVKMGIITEEEYRESNKNLDNISKSRSNSDTVYRLLKKLEELESKIEKDIETNQNQKEWENVRNEIFEKKKILQNKKRNFTKESLRALNNKNILDEEEIWKERKKISEMQREIWEYIDEIEKKLLANNEKRE